MIACPQWQLTLGKGLGVTLSFLLSLAVAPHAAGQSKAEVAPPLSAEQADRAAEARELYGQAKAAFARADYATAIELFQKVHQETEHPALLFNLAQAHRLSGKGHCLEAKRLYEAYRSSEDNVPNKKEVNERIAELTPCASEEEELARRATQSGPPPIEPEATPVLAKVLTFTGGAILLSGVALFTASQIRYSQAQSECPCEPGSLDEWQTMSNVSYGLMAGGGALALGGGIYWWVSTPGSSLSPGDGNPGDGSSREGGLTLGISGVF